MGMFGRDATGRDDDARIEACIGRTMLVLSKLYMYPLYCIVVLLWTIHTTLVLCNSTTFELTKGPEHIDYLAGTSMTDFPFGGGILYNMRTFIRRDDIYRRVVLYLERWGLSFESWRCRCRRANEPNETDEETTIGWVPILWQMPKSIDGDSADWWNHPWKNKYWSCC